MFSLGKKKYPLCTGELNTREMCLLKQDVRILHPSLYNRDWLGEVEKNRGRMNLKINVVQRGVCGIHRDLVDISWEAVLFRRLERVNVVAIQTARW